MLKIKEVADHLGLSKPQARRRIKAIKGIVKEDSISRGDHNKILVKQDAYQLLKQLEQLRRQGKSTKEAKKIIKEELGNGDGDETSETHETDPLNHNEPNQSDTHQSSITQLEFVKEQYERRLEEKAERIRELREDKKRLQEKNDTLEQRLLKGEVEKEAEDEFKELGLIQVVKKWFTTKT